jgi:putative membrane protein
MSGDDPGAKSGLRAAIALVVFVAGAIAVNVLSDNAYLWFKALHIMAVIAWMAGLLYLPRLFIYHHEKAPGSDASETFKTMETRLYRFIMNPAMMLSWILGFILVWHGQWFDAAWLHAKFVAVLAMTGMHVYYGFALRAFGRDQRPRTTRHWRMVNEVPALLMVIIVLLVVLKPF